MLRTAKLYEDIQNASHFGIDIDTNTTIKIDWDKLMARKNQVVNQLVGGIGTLLKHNGVDVIKGHADVVVQGKIEVNNEVLTYKHLIIATGSRTFMPHIKGLEEAYSNGTVIDSTGAIHLKRKTR